MAALLHPRAPAQGKSSHWQAPQVCTVTRMVPVPMASLGDLRHRLQATAAMGNRVPPQSTRNEGQCPIMFPYCSNSTQQLKRTEGQWVSSDPTTKPIASFHPGT
ncbi:UNVERIFIED_CONTAM: hypothetical protein FKN15_070325 [Acipenser sinensis]